MIDFEPDPLQLMSVDEIFDQADEALLRKLDEDRRIERKPTKYGGDALGDYFSASLAESVGEFWLG